MSVFYRAVVVCTQDPCTYCQGPAQRHIQEFEFGTGPDAAEHGRRMTRNVYGSSVHRVEVEMSETTPWRVVTHFNG